LLCGWASFISAIKRNPGNIPTRTLSTSPWMVMTGVMSCFGSRADIGSRGCYKLPAVPARYIRYDTVCTVCTVPYRDIMSQGPTDADVHGLATRALYVA